MTKQIVLLAEPIQQPHLDLSVLMAQLQGVLETGGYSPVITLLIIPDELPEVSDERS